MRETSDRTAASAEQDQTARMCRLILLCTLRKIISWRRERHDKGKVKHRLNDKLLHLAFDAGALRAVKELELKRFAL